MKDDNYRDATNLKIVDVHVDFILYYKTNNKLEFTKIILFYTAERRI